jgi:thioredoxin-dependent peroxiredoxin
MSTARIIRGIACFLMFVTAGCATPGAGLPVDSASSQPGTSVTMKGEQRQLVGTPVAVGKPLPATVLVDAFSMKKVDLSAMTGRVLFLNIVPSLDTRVCEAQTHYLAEEGKAMPPDIVRITISRDTPFAQKRFAEEAKLTALMYLSDYRDASFGRSTGILLEDNMLLARAVIIVDKSGIVRYMQVVPELTHLPDMATAFARASELD